MLDPCLESHLRKVCTSESYRLGAATLRFLRLPAAPRFGSPGHRSLDEGVGSRDVEVVERPSGAQVGAVHVRNHSRGPVLLLAGEILRGGRQDRVSNTDAMIRPGTEVALPVSCVERLRWARGEPGFSSGGSAAPGIRSVLSRTVTSSLSVSGVPSSDQAAVWEAVDQVGQRLGTRSRTASLSNHCSQRRELVEEVLRELPQVADACGVVMQTQNHMVVLDVFDRPETFARYRIGLMEGYALHVVLAGPLRGAAAFPPPGDTRRLLAGLSVSEFATIGLGRELRVSSLRALGSALVVAGVPVHLSLFAA